LLSELELDDPDELLDLDLCFDADTDSERL